jgi:signal transduction histidine kinase
VSGAPGSPVGRALASDAPVLVRDLGRRGFRAPLLDEHAIGSGIETVIGGPARPWGVLGAYADRSRRFTSHDVDFVCVVANVLALALQHASEVEHAVTQARASTEQRIRAQITQLLHDEALQSLLAARQHLACAVQRPDRHDAVLRARAGVQRAIGELRGAVGALHPVPLDGRRLREAIQEVVAHQARCGGFTAAVELALEPSLDCGPLVLSVIRELAANVAEHAGASTMQIVLRGDGEDLVLEVTDDGCGIPPRRVDEAFAAGHIGLASAIHRVHALDGGLTIESPPGGGTAVRVVLPGRGAATAEAETVHFSCPGDG